MCIIKRWNVLRIKRSTIEGIKTEARKAGMPVGQYLDSLFSDVSISDRKKLTSWTLYDIPINTKDEIKRKARAQNLQIGEYLKQLINSDDSLKVRNQVLTKVYKNLEDSMKEYHKNGLED